MPLPVVRNIHIVGPGSQTGLWEYRPQRREGTGAAHRHADASQCAGAGDGIASVGGDSLVAFSKLSGEDASPLAVAPGDAQRETGGSQSPRRVGAKRTVAAEDGDHRAVCRKSRATGTVHKL